MYITRLASNEIFLPSNKIYREVGRANNLSSPLYCHQTLCTDRKTHRHWTVIDTALENKLKTLKKKNNFVWKNFGKITIKWDNDVKVEISDRGTVDGTEKRVEFGHD